MGKIYISGHAAVPGEISVIQHIVIEAVTGKEIAPVVGSVNSPVVTKPLGAENKNPVITQLKILDDGQGLEGLSETNAIRDYATAEAIELIYGPYDSVTLKLIEFLPY